MSILNSGRRTSSVARRASLSVAVAAALAIHAPSAFGVSATWQGGDTLWATGTNWVGGVPAGDVGTTTNTDTATFPSAGVGAVVVDAGRNVQSILFSNVSATAYTLSGGPLVLTGGGSITSSSQTANIGTPITLAGSNVGYSFTSNVASTNRQLQVTGSVTGSSTAGQVTTLTLDGAGGSGINQFVSGAITDGAAGGKVAVVKNGANPWLLTSASNAFTGGLTVNAGNLSLTQANSGGTGGLTINGGTVTFSNSTAVGGAITATGGTLNLGNQTTTFVGNTVTLSGANANVNVSTANVSAGFSGLFVGSADQTITTVGANAVNFSTSAKQFNGFLGTFNVAAGTFLAFRSTTVNNGGDSTTFNVNGGLSSRNGGAIALGALTGTGTLSSGNSASGASTLTYTIGAKGIDAIFSGAITDADTALAKRVAIVKTGAGAQTFAGASTYTGATTVNAGKLVTGNNAALGASNVNVAAGTLTVGNGTVNTVGGLTGLTVASGATLEEAAVTSLVTLASGNYALGNINLDLNNLFNAIGTYTLIDAPALGGTIGTTNFVDADTTNFSFAFAPDATTGDAVLTVTAAAVPEPTALAALGLAGVALVAAVAAADRDATSARPQRAAATTPPLSRRRRSVPAQTAALAPAARRRPPTPSSPINSRPGHGLPSRSGDRRRITPRRESEVLGSSGNPPDWPSVFECERAVRPSRPRCAAVTPPRSARGFRVAVRRSMLRR